MKEYIPIMQITCLNMELNNFCLQELTPELKQIVAEVFQIFDKDGSKTIDRAEAQKHWAQVRFGKVSANEFFNTVDFNNDGQVAFDEFVEFWEIVKGSGHTEEEIKEEVSHI